MPAGAGDRAVSKWLGDLNPKWSDLAPGCPWDRPRPGPARFSPICSPVDQLHYLAAAESGLGAGEEMDALLNAESFAGETSKSGLHPPAPHSGHVPNTGDSSSTACGHIVLGWPAPGLAARSQQTATATSRAPAGPTVTATRLARGQQQLLELLLFARRNHHHIRRPGNSFLPAAFPRPRVAVAQFLAGRGHRMASTSVRRAPGSRSGCLPLRAVPGASSELSQIALPRPLRQGCCCC
jgi:hypothetical protein